MIGARREGNSYNHNTCQLLCSQLTQFYPRFKKCNNIGKLLIPFVFLAYNMSISYRTAKPS